MRLFPVELAGYPLHFNARRALSRVEARSWSGKGRGLVVWQSEAMEKIPLTRAGFTLLDEELKQLKSVDRPAVIRAIAEAREHGDLSENAEYHAAREKQSFIEGRVKELEAILSRAEVIDPSKFTGSVKFGAHVVVADEDNGEEKTYQIVGEVEADLERGLLNIRSPLARAMIGKDEGDTVEVRTPGGQKSYEIISVRFI
jgi:transcription elongation factor GreA